MNSFDNDRFRKLLLCYPSKAIKFLYDAYGERLVRFSLTFTHNEAASEDIVQETLNMVWEKHETLARDHASPIEAFLYRVVRNKSISYYKAHAHLESCDVLAPELITVPVHSVEDITIQHEFFERIRFAIGTFPRRERECLLMQVDEGLTTKEIAETLEVSVKAVQRSLTCAYKRLRQTFAGR